MIANTDLVLENMTFSLNVLFCKKRRIWASTESFLKLSDLKVPVSYEFLKGSVTIFVFTKVPSRNFQNTVFEACPMVKHH